MMIAVAVIIDSIGLIGDLVALIPGAEAAAVAGTVGDIFAAILFGIWFSHQGISILTKRPIGFLGTILGEFVPGLNMAPFWTFFVATTLAKERAESAV